MIPSRPRIIDPANPSNNLYKTGIGKYYPNSTASDYEEGDGDWTLLVRYIDSIDLTKSIEELQQKWLSKLTVQETIRNVPIVYVRFSFVFDLFCCILSQSEENKLLICEGLTEPHYHSKIMHRSTPMQHMTL